MVYIKSSSNKKVSFNTVHSTLHKGGGGEGGIWTWGGGGHYSGAENKNLSNTRIFGPKIVLWNVYVAFLKYASKVRKFYAFVIKCGKIKNV